MATPIPVARVSAVHGEVFAKDPGGVLRPLRAGDFIFDHEIIVTGENSAIDFADMNGQALNLGARETLAMDAEVLAQDGTGASDSAVQVSDDDFSRVIAALNEGQSLDNLLEETAAGGAAAGGGEAGGGPTFVRLLRITESVDPLSYEFETVRSDALEYPINGGQDSDPDEQAPDQPGDPGDPGDPGGPDPHGPPAIDLPSIGRDDPRGYRTLENQETSGVFTIHTEAGLDSSSALSINGQPISLLDLTAASPVNEIHVVTPKGNLYLTGYNSVTGEVSWRYEPYNWSDPAHHDSFDHASKAGATGDDGYIHDTFEVVVKDGDGHTASDDMRVWIEDTSPDAQNDHAYVDGAHIDASGNVMSTDTLGSDHTKIDGVISVTNPDGRLQPDPDEGFTPGGSTATIEGQYGTLVIERDGSYTYTLDPTKVTGGECKDYFTYSLRDSDGSYDDATLTIHINDPGHSFVSRSLPLGESLGEVLLASDLLDGDGQSSHGIDSLAQDPAFDVYTPPVSDVSTQALIEHNLDQHLVP
jgi:VCBS repeat-containing protein